MDLNYYKRYYCSDIENVENYQKAKKDNFIGWECHHRLETHTPDGERREVDIGYKELKALRMYYNRPASELIFLTTREHNAFKKGKPGPNKGKHHSDEAKKRMRSAKKGENNPAFGKHWYNNSKIEIMAKECPENFVPGRLR